MISQGSGTGWRFFFAGIMVIVNAGRAVPEFSTELSDSLKSSTSFTFDALFEDWLMADNYVYDTRDYQYLADSIVSSLGDVIRSDLRDTYTALKSASGGESEWESLYIELCAFRRKTRLTKYHDYLEKIVFVKKKMDRRQGFVKHKSDFEPSEMTLLEVSESGVCRQRTLYETEGVERDPCVSYDGKKLLFAAGKTYHLHEMDLSTEEVRQITFDHSKQFTCRDLNGVYLPNGDIMFSSDRSRVKIPCNGGPTMNLYLCDGDGNYIRRIGFDQASDFFLTMLPDGRVLYTRWGYNDRERWNTFDLFTVRPDGTGQIGFYGNETCFPQLISCARPIPGTSPTKVVIVCAGKESNKIEGPMAVVSNFVNDVGDPTASYEFVGVREDPDVWCGLDIPKGDFEPYFSFPFRTGRADYRPGGPMYSYPFPLNEETYLVSVRHTFKKHAICLVFADGSRELLANDPDVQCLQAQAIVPWEKLWKSPRPSAIPSVVDYEKNTAECFIQDIYVGRGLEGVSRGEAKKIRVAALDFRTSNGPTVDMGFGNGGSTNHNTPSLRGGSWDVKQIVGEAEIKEDGSAAFEVPANTPLFFQVLDENGHLIQTMREWATFMPGERGSCIGCHETRFETPPPRNPLANVAEPLREFYGPPRGFDFATEIQPILDNNCITCHNGTPHQGKAIKDLRGDQYRGIGGAQWSHAYLNLIDYDESCGKSSGTCTNFPVWEGTLLTYFGFDDPTPVVPPKKLGSSNSKLISMLEDGHNDVELPREAIEKIACWIDFAIPFFGKYVKDGDHSSVSDWLEQEESNIQDYLKTLSHRNVHPDRASGASSTRRFPVVTLTNSRLSFDIPDGPVAVEIQVLDSRGRTIRRLVNEQLSAGQHTVPYLTAGSGKSDISPGCYFFSVRIGDRRVAIPHVLNGQ